MTGAAAGHLETAEAETAAADPTDADTASDQAGE
jgi:hypothetical protein